MTRDAIIFARGMKLCAGPLVEAFRLRGPSPRERAWARLRQAEAAPRRRIAAWLAVEMAIANDPQPELKPKFRRVQSAKLVHRMESGTHKRWDQTKLQLQPDGTQVTRRIELHV